MTKVCLPGVVIAPIEYFDVAVIAHVVIETNHLINAISQIVLFALVVMKVIDPFDSDAYVHANAHICALLWIPPVRFVVIIMVMQLTSLLFLRSLTKTKTPRSS